MQVSGIGIFLPDVKIRLNIHSFYAVKRDDIKLPGRAVVFDRVAGSSNDPSFRDRMRTEGFVLEKLQHGRNQRFRHAVDFINKKNTLFAGGFFNLFIYGCNDLAHCVFRYGVFFSLKVLFYNYGKSDCTLACVVCDRIGNKTDSAFFCNLFHNGGLSDAGRPDKQQRTLAHSRHEIASMCILSGVNLYCVKQFFFCIFDIHKVMYPFSGRSVWEGQRSLPEILIVQIEFCSPYGNLLVQGFFMIKNKCGLISGWSLRINSVTVGKVQKTF